MKLDPAIYRDLLLSLLPEVVLTGWALVLLLFVAWRHRTARDLRIAGWLTLLALLSTAVATWWLWWNRASVQGALLVMINHGISTGALFFLAGMIYERRHSRLIEAYGGIARVVPLFAAILTIVSLSSIALPGTNGFVGEFLILIGSFRTYPIATAVATTGVIVAAAYLLTALQRVIYNPLTQHENEKLTDLTPREIAVLVPLIVCILWIGIYPKPILQRMEPSARALIEQIKPATAQAPAATGGGHP